MGFDIVSLLSVCVYAALAIAYTVLFTIVVGPLVPDVRAVLDAYNVRATLTTMVNTCLTSMSDGYIQLSHGVVDVVHLSRLQLSKHRLSLVGSYVCSTSAQLCTLGSGIGSVSRRIASDSLSTRLFDYARSFIGTYADSLLSLRSVWIALSICFICFILLSLWIFFSFEAPLDDNELRHITTLSTQLTHAVRKLDKLSKQVQQQIPLALAVICAIIILWPTQVLRVACYRIPPARRMAYFQGSLAGLQRCNNGSFYELYGRLARLALVSISRLVSLVAATLVIIGLVLYFGAILYTIWEVYLTRQLATAAQEEASLDSILRSSLDHSITPSSHPSIKAHTLSSRFPEDYHIHPDFNAKYEIEAELGAGGNGFVLQARRRTDGQQVAVKFVVIPEWASRRWTEHPTYGRVSNDVIVMDLVRHENIIALLDVFSDETYLYVVQELHGTLSYPPGAYNMRKWPNGSRCLESYIRANGPMPLEDAKYVFYQLVDAVERLHSKGVAHCDIKPDNILIDANLKIKLIDFGNVFRLPEDCIPGEGRLFNDDPEWFRGTRIYTPPEILNGEEYEAMAADVWAMGLVLCYMLVGRLPFSDLNYLRMGWFNNLGGDWEALLPVWFIVGRCLSLDHLWRPRAFQLQLRDDFFPIALEQQKFLGVNWHDMSRRNFKYYA
ncbi:kinase-like domain-containing protein [Irpex rosettiformis]|uniref:Kinase-like domain-containing protein n=1 Tax=Irpex rosettiformis TaxID=378272 RepID=A0ACB8TQW6_9APHY|nr:kinase-like domain-containing protein [Irpex rosettiformis]